MSNVSGDVPFLWPRPLWQKAVGRGAWWWWAMMGMEEKPGGRPLMLGGWPGKGVSAGDKGKLLYTQHIRDAERDNGEETQGLSFGKKAKKQPQTPPPPPKNKQQRPPWLFLCLRSHFVLQVVALMYHSTHIIPSLMYHYLLMLGNYCLLIFKLHWCWLHLRGLFTSTFNLPGGWVWLQGTILTSLSDNQTKLALELLSCDCLKFLDTLWIWKCYCSEITA